MSRFYRFQRIRLRVSDKFIAMYFYPVKMLFIVSTCAFAAVQFKCVCGRDVIMYIWQCNVAVQTLKTILCKDFTLIFYLPKFYGENLLNK